VAHAAALGRIDEAALLFFNLRGRGYQQEEAIDSHQSARECFRFREIALDDLNSRECNGVRLRSIANKGTSWRSALGEFLD
jgi:hypothetical protein